MYSRCLVCTSALGRNSLIESFPIGRRLAFDGARGRLWVVCRKCERWNLTPLEERWAAMETAERLYRDTKLRVATDQVGLARFTDDLGRFELVRIGKPMRREFAAWRYGDQFGRRRRRAAALSVGSLTIVLGAALGSAVGFAGAGLLSFAQLATSVQSVRSMRRLVRVPAGDGRPPIVLKRTQASSARLICDAPDAWRLSVPSYDESRRRARWWSSGGPRREIVLEGGAALRVLGALTAALNADGASSRSVQEAVEMLEQHESAHRLIASTAAANAARRNYDGDGVLTGTLRTIPHEARLALEMASHEETERRAMEGELALLEAAWQDAEEIARIADAL